MIFKSLSKLELLPLQKRVRVEVKSKKVGTDQYLLRENNGGRRGRKQTQFVVVQTDKHRGVIHITGPF